MRADTCEGNCVPGHPDAPVYDRRVAGIGGAHQDVRFCRAPDGVRIAYAVHGSGPPLVVTTCWLSHLQHDWQSPVWRHFLRDLGEVATVIRYDERGHGLSDRDVEDFSLEARVGDLEAVVEHSGVDRFAVMAMSQGGPVAIRYVAAHPDRVTRVIFYGSYAAAMPDPSGEDLEMQEAIDRIIKVGWSRPTAEFRRVFTTLMIPGATEEQMTWLDELQRVAVTADTLFKARQQRVARRRDRRPRPADDADVDPALGRRPDERLRVLPHARLAHPGRAAGASREQQPHRARPRARLGRVRRRGVAVHGGRRSR